MSASEGPSRRVERIERILLNLLFWTAAFFLIAGVVNASHLVRHASMSKRLGESGLRGVATVTEKDARRVHPRGGLSFWVTYHVTSPPLSETREVVLQEEQWYPLAVGQSLVYLYEESDPTAGILEVQRPYLENWLRQGFGLIPGTLICGGYVGWWVTRRWRGQAVTAR
jgi:hypothetical protein